MIDAQGPLCWITEIAKLYFPVIHELARILPCRRHIPLVISSSR
jgi:hypothetical protein